jgi:hypothetical protein
MKHVMLPRLYNLFIQNVSQRDIRKSLPHNPELRRQLTRQYPEDFLRLQDHFKLRPWAGWFFPNPQRSHWAQQSSRKSIRTMSGGAIRMLAVWRSMIRFKEARQENF